MTFRALFAPAGFALCLSLFLAPPAQALDLAAMSEAERDALRIEIRNYLMENPEVIMEAVAILEQREREAQAQFDRDLVAANQDDLFNDSHSWAGGNPDGDITLVEFMDYQCGYCHQAFIEIQQLLETDGNLRLVLKELPVLGEESVLAARFAIATLQVAGDDAYKFVHDALMSRKGPITQTLLTRLVEPLNLDTQAILGRMESEEVDKVIQDNRALAARLQIRGTPALVMNDELLRGYLPLDALLEIAEDIRAR